MQGLKCKMAVEIGKGCRFHYLLLFLNRNRRNRAASRVAPWAPCYLLSCSPPPAGGYEVEVVASRSGGGKWGMAAVVERCWSRQREEQKMDLPKTPSARLISEVFIESHDAWVLADGLDRLGTATG